MKLTKVDKEAFVEAVLDDVPEVDYCGQAERMLRKWGVDALPAGLQRYAASHPEYLAVVYVYAPDGLNCLSMIAPPEWEHRGLRNLHPDKYAVLEALGEQALGQYRAREALKEKVAAMIETCSTLKVARERLPEFEKYLPADRDGSRLANLPVANTVADLMAAGWPKGS